MLVQLAVQKLTVTSDHLSGEMKSTFSCRDQLGFRIHVSTGELVGVFYKSFLLHVHQDPLTAHRTDVVGQAPAGHASLVVVLKTHT